MLADPLGRLAAAVMRLDERRALAAQLHEAIRPLAEADIVTVVGEQELAATLDETLESARAALQQVRDAGGDDPVGALEALLTAPEWEIAAELVGVLEGKRAEQAKHVVDYENRCRDWRATMDSLNRVLATTIKEGGLVRHEKATIDRFDAVVQQAGRALEERRYQEVDRTLRRLDADRAEHGLEAIEASLDEARERARHLRTHAGVSIIQAPLDSNRRYRYAVILRTASAPGTNSINIQDSSTLVAQDRDHIKAIIDEVTEAVDQGLSRRFQITRHVGAVAQAAAEPEAAGATEPLQHRVTRVGSMMYRLVMPEPMQGFVGDVSSSLSITTNDLELPWELMHDDRDFLCLTRPVARMPMGRAFPRRLRKHVQSGLLRFLLIYSDPDGNLPKAAHEVEAVREALEQEWESRIEIQVLRGDEVTGRRLNRLLTDEAFDVIHYAGHAAFDPDDPDLSGLLLHDREVFFAQKIRRLLTGRPLVFLNACETGRTANENTPQKVGQYLGTPAEGLASAFLYGGALACIGSLWPIFDRSAEQFAIRFYQYVLEGNLVGEAMRLARVDIKQEFPEDITWASFVLYGDPTFGLVHSID